jgi:hypothetical protein
MLTTRASIASAHSIPIQIDGARMTQKDAIVHKPAVIQAARVPPIPRETAIDTANPPSR